MPFHAHPSTTHALAALALAMAGILAAPAARAGMDCTMQDSATGTPVDGNNFFPVGEDQLACGRSNTAARDHVTAIGLDNYVDGDEGTALGYLNTVRNGELDEGFPDEFQLPIGATAIGTKNTANGDRATAIGAGNTADGENSTALGNNNLALGDDSSVVGGDNQALGDASSVFGTDNFVEGDDNTAIGSHNNVANASNAPPDAPLATESSAFGTNNFVVGSHGTAVGNGNVARGEAATAVGYSNSSEGDETSTFGHDNLVIGTTSTALGADNQALGDQSTSVGTGNIAGKVWQDDDGDGELDAGEYAYYATAVGNRNQATGNTSAALGYLNGATGTGAAAVGSGNIAAGDFSGALGVGSGAVRAGTTAIGGATTSLPAELPPPDADGGATVVISGHTMRFEPVIEPDNLYSTFNVVSIDGKAVTIDPETLMVDFDGQTLSLQEYSAVLGSALNGGAIALGENATAVGARSSAFGAGSVAAGVGSVADRDGNVAIGMDARASADNSVALGAGSIADRADSVSIGSVGNERQLTHVADGTQATDAVNLSQLQDTLATANAYTDTAVATGGTLANAYTDNREAAIREDMTAGDADTLDQANTHADAGDAQTLSAANAYTDERVSNLATQDDFDAFRGDVDRRLGAQNDRLDRVGALGAAMVGMAASASAVEAGQTRIGFAAGAYGGKQAVSIGVQQRLGRRAALTLGGAFSGSERSATVGVGIGF